MSNNTYNRLMSRSSTTTELRRLAKVFGWGSSEFLTTTVECLRTVFGDEAEPDRCLADVVVPRICACCRPVLR